MIILEMITLDVPYNEYDTIEETVKNKRIGNLPKDLYKIPNDDIQQFIKKLLDKDPNNRPSIDKLLEDSFLEIKPEDGKIVNIPKTFKVKEKEKKKES